MPFAIGPLIGFGVFAALIVGAFFLIDAIGDRREAQVRAEYTEAARRKNVNIGAFNTAQKALDAVIDAKVQEALKASGKIPSEHKASAEQAAALNAIRRAGR